MVSKPDCHALHLNCELEILFVLLEKFQYKKKLHFMPKITEAFCSDIENVFKAFT